MPGTVHPLTPFSHGPTPLLTSPVPGGRSGCKPLSWRQRHSTRRKEDRACRMTDESAVTMGAVGQITFLRQVCWPFDSSFSSQVSLAMCMIILLSRRDPNKGLILWHFYTHGGFCSKVFYMQIIISKQLNKCPRHPLRSMPVSVPCKGSRPAGEARRDCFWEGRFWSGSSW